MSTHEDKPALIFKRLLNQRDFLSQLLVSPNFGTNCKRINQIEFTPNPHLNIHEVDAVARLPALELKCLLLALSEECRTPQIFPGVQSWDVDNDESSITDFSPIDDLERNDNKNYVTRKRPNSFTKSSHQLSKRMNRGNSNHHSILRFIERTLEHRYHFRYNRKEGRDDQRYKFLDGELKSYYGTSDAIFQAEEEIRCLVFEMAYDGIVKCFHHASYCHGNTTKRVDECDNESNAPFLKFIHSLPNISTIDETILRDGILATALRIIDSVIDYDQKERRSRELLHETMSNRQLLLKSLIADRRFGKEHQSQQPKRNVNHRLHVSSIIEQRYKKEYLWIKNLKERCQLFPLSSQKDDSMKHGIVQDKICDGGYACDSNKSIKLVPNIVQNVDNSIQSGFEFIVIRRNIDSEDTLCLSGDVNDDEAMNKHCEKRDIRAKVSIDQNETPRSTSNHDIPLATTEPDLPSFPLHHDLDNEARELRQNFLDMSLNELSSAQVILYATESLGNLLRRYGELYGAAGISRCGDVVVRGINATGQSDVVECESEKPRFLLNDAIVSALIKNFLTDATGALRTKAFLRSFVLPLIEQMNPVASELGGAGRGDEKPASRLLSALLTTLAGDRPTELVESVIFPILTMTKTTPLKADAPSVPIEPSRFQCELIARLLHGKGALALTAIALLVELLHPITNVHRGMEWNEKTMPLVTACLNRQPSLDDRIVARLADEVSHNLTTDLKQSMAKSMKLSTLFHTLVNKYGAQLKALGKIDHLKGAANKLKTFMSKSISTLLKKL